MRVTWRNAIESPAKINRVTAELTRGGPHVAAEVRNLTLPLELRPGEEVTFVIAPAAPLEGPSSPQAVIVERNLDVLADRDLVWQAILDPTVPAQYTQKVTVKTFSDTFIAPVEHPEKQIRSIIVEFDSGDTMEINADKLQAEATLHLPVGDIVLRRVTDGTYPYRRTVVRRGSNSVTKRGRLKAAQFSFSKRINRSVILSQAKRNRVVISLPNEEGSHVQSLYRNGDNDDAMQVAVYLDSAC